MENKYRSFMYGDEEKNTQWRFGAPPNYDVVDSFFEQGRSKIWPTGSLEEKVQNLMKTWEMEMVHKICPNDYKSIDPKKFTFSLNGRKGISLEELRKLNGSYNAFLQTSLPEKFRIYNPDEENAESSDSAFRTAFPRGFAIEVLNVYSGPPFIVFKFRHWGFSEGVFKGHPPTHEMVEFFGMAIFQVDDNMKILSVEFFFDRGELLGGLTKGGAMVSSSEHVATKCPVMSNIG